MYTHIDALVTQLESMPHMSIGSGYAVPDTVLDQKTRSYRRNTLEELKHNLHEEWRLALETIFPYQLPSDYRYFLQTYGGLAWRTHERYGYISGVGSPARIEYNYLRGGYGCAIHNGFLIMGGIDFVYTKWILDPSPRPKNIYYLLDLGGTIARNAILQMDASSGKNHEDMIDANVAFYATRDPKQYHIADSFTEFLQAIVATEGRLDEQFRPLLLDPAYLPS